MKSRCEWCSSDPLYISYHDDEWGVPVHNDRQLFEMLCLEGAQAGLNWLTILKKRDGYRQAFENFEWRKIADFTSEETTRLAANPAIVRNRMKIESVVKNAQAAISVIEEFGSLDKFLWGYVDGTPIQNSWKSLDQIPAKTAQSIAMSKELKRRRFSFVGPTICYAFMQAVGMVNDHTTDCFRYRQIREMT